jgi:hypothetical protein
MVPKGSLQDRSAIIQFPNHHRPGYPGRKGFVIGQPVLLPAKQDVSGDGSYDPCQKTAVFRKEANSYVLLGAEAHQEGTAGYLAEADDPA